MAFFGIQLIGYNAEMGRKLIASRAMVRVALAARLVLAMVRVALAARLVLAMVRVAPVARFALCAAAREAGMAMQPARRTA